MPKHSKTKTTKPITRSIIKVFLARIEEATKDRPKITDKEKLIWFFRTLIKEGEHNEEDLLMVPFDKLLVAPYFYNEKYDDIYQDFSNLIRPIQTDKDFYRKHNMLNYKPDFTFDESGQYSEHGAVFFKDFTDDFMRTYLKDKLGVKSNSVINSSSIQKIEIIKSEEGRIKVYINGKYDSDPLDFARGKNWQLMYKVANKEYVSYDKKGKEFYDYFNHIKKNPLYATHGFEITKILKEEDGYIVPNIEIRIITKNKTTRQLKSA